MAKLPGPIPATQQSDVSSPKTSKSWWANLSPKNKKTINLIGILLLIVAIGSSAFWFGKQDGQPEPSPSPTPELTLEVEVEEAEEFPTASPSAIPSPSPTPTPTPAPSTQSKTLSATASLDGFRSSNNAGNDSFDIRAGRNTNLITRGFVSFDLGDIPDGATIESVKLRLYQATIIGDPYGIGSMLKVDHLDYGDSLENADYSASSLSSSFATLTAESSIGWKEVDVTDQVKSDIAAGRSRSQFRLHMATENQGGDVTGDFVYLESADDSEGTGNTPQLNVKYSE